MLRKLTIGSIIILFTIGVLSWQKYASVTANNGQQIVEVSVPNLSQNATQGKELFDKNCSVCHGQNAAGKHEIAPPLVHIIYEPNHHGDQAFLLAAKNGIRAHHWPFGNMPPVEAVTKEQVKLITEYVRELQRANGIN